MELRQIRFAVAVAEDRHFGRAAERMFIAQPALSQHIRRLEQELGAKIFDRGARHVRVTPAGEAFLAVAQHILRQADEAAAAARRAEAGETGSVSVGVSLAVAAPLLSVALRRWTAARPAVRTSLVAGRSRALVDLVRRREIDVAFVEAPVADDRLSSVPLLDEPLVALLPSHHRLVHAETIAMSALSGEPFVTVSRDGSQALHDRLITSCAAAGMTPVVALEVDDASLVPVAVTAGLGVGLVPRALAAATMLPGLAWRPVEDAAVITVAAVAVSEGASPQARELLDLLIRLRDRNGLKATATRHLELAHPSVERTAS